VKEKDAWSGVKKNLTTEVAELAEEETAKGSRPRRHGKERANFRRFPEGQNDQGSFRK